MSDEFEGKLFINQRNESDDAQLQEWQIQREYTTVELSTMKPFRPLVLMPKTFIKLLQSRTHTYTNTQIWTNILKNNTAETFPKNKQVH